LVINDNFPESAMRLLSRFIRQLRGVSLFPLVVLLAAGLPGCSDDDDAFQQTGDVTDGLGDFSDDDGLTELESELLAMHNDVRASATNPDPSPALPAMSWNDGLAAVAQDYAEECDWDHNSARSEQYGGDVYVGENLAAFTGSDQVNMDQLFSGWENEAQFYDYETNSCQSGEQCGHYTQIVWRESVEVGCGWTQCPQVEGLNGWSDVWILVCNYAPGGNYQGQRPY
jgi:hypothetical protein